MKNIKLHYKNIKLILLLLILVTVNSCKKYLEVKPDSKLTVPTTLMDLQAILDYTDYMNIKTTPGFGSSSSDDYFLLESGYNVYSKEAQKIYTWNRGDYVWQNSWSKAYHAIYNA